MTNFNSLAVRALAAADAYAEAYREDPRAEKTTASRSALADLLIEDERQRLAFRAEIDGALRDHAMTARAITTSGVAEKRNG